MNETYKLTNTIMTIKRIQFTILTVLFFSLTTFAQSSKQTVEELLGKSGSTAMFKQFDGMLDSQIAEKKTSFENENDFNKFSSIMRSCFNSTKAEAFFTDYFVKYTNEDSLKSIIKIYNNQLMQDMTKLEEEANSPLKQQEMQDYFAGLKNNPPKQDRIQSIMRLNSTVGASEMTLQLIENMIFSIARGVNQTQPKTKQISQDELEKSLKKIFTENFKQQITNQIITAYLFTYKDVDSDKLNSYIQIWETSTGKYFSKSSLDALNYTFSNMAEDVGNSLGGFVK